MKFFTLLFIFAAMLLCGFLEAGDLNTIDSALEAKACREAHPLSWVDSCNDL